MTTAAPTVYSQCGLRLRSEVEVSLPTIAGSAWDVDVVWGPDVDDTTTPPEGDLVASYELRDSTWYTATATSTGYRLQFTNCGEFEISADLARVVVRKDPSGSRPNLLPILLAGTVSSFLLALGGATVLHASAVAIDGAALAFVGQSGRGKTTVAALMCVDGAALGGRRPRHRRHRTAGHVHGRRGRAAAALAAASIADARPDATTRVTADERSALSLTTAPLGPLPLAAIVVPAPSRTASEVAITRVPASEALFALLAFPRVHGWRLPEVLTRDFTTMSRLVNEVPVYAATIPWGPPFDPSVAPALARLAAGEHAATSG